MAHRRPRVFLGYEDETITDKYKSQVNFTTNKAGGKPDWAVDSVTPPLCKLCGLSLPLILQVYAPLENSSYHRTLYIFACINPNCWNQSESWVCLRSQTLDTSPNEQPTIRGASAASGAVTDWCADADDWNEDAENGNLRCSPSNNIESCQQMDDEGDEDDGEEGCMACGNSGTIDSDDDPDEAADSDGQSTDGLSSQFSTLQVKHRDANFNGPLNSGRAEGAAGSLHPPQATAEIEGDESEVVSIDTPTGPQVDLRLLIRQVNPLPCGLHSPQFIPFFVSVAEEELRRHENSMTEHIRQLLQEYQRKEDYAEPSDGAGAGAACGGGDAEDVEKYERCIPAHGDSLFHTFVQRIQQNPGQILRYCREGGSPLPISPLPEPPSRCNYCKGDMVFELQVLPSLIPKLGLLPQAQAPASDVSGTHLEFGTALVWTCRRSCWAVGDNVREERIVVQAEHF